jgi:transcriptional regulator with XRE-family HTH domain
MRRNLDLTQAQVAKRCDMSFQQIQKYEAGMVDISIGKLLDLANALGVSIMELVSDLPDRIPANTNATPRRTSPYDQLEWLEQSRSAR